jgi:hypothetical protein
MKTTDFFEAANELLNWVSSLSLATESGLREAEDLICRKSEVNDPARPEASLPMKVRRIGSKIEEVMCAYDLLCRAAGYPPAFELFFQLHDAPRLVQWEVKQILKKKCHYQQ